MDFVEEAEAQLMADGKMVGERIPDITKKYLLAAHDAEVQRVTDDLRLERNRLKEMCDTLADTSGLHQRQALMAALNKEAQIVEVFRLQWLEQRDKSERLQALVARLEGRKFRDITTGEVDTDELKPPLTAYRQGQDARNGTDMYVQVNIANADNELVGYLYNCSDALVELFIQSVNERLARRYGHCVVEMQKGKTN